MKYYFLASYLPEIHRDDIKIRVSLGDLLEERFHIPEPDWKEIELVLLGRDVLVLEKLLSAPVLYLSRYIIRNKADYYRFLQEVRTKDGWTEWLLYMLKAIEETSYGTLHLIDEIRKAMEITAGIMKKQSGKLYSKDFLELLFEKPYIRISDIVDEGIASRNIAANYLRTLEKTGVVRSEKKGRDVLYVNVRLFNILKK